MLSSFLVMEIEIERTSLAARPDLATGIDRLSALAWPAFLLHGNVASWRALFGPLALHQILFLAPAGDLLAVGHAVPLHWNGTVDDLPPTIEDCLRRALAPSGPAPSGLDPDTPPNTLCAVAAMVHPAARGRGLSRRLVEAMRAHASALGLTGLIAPVRPTWKDRYPLIPLDRYAAWKRPDGAPFDPWIRIHRALGAKPLGVAPATLTVEGSVAEWESWTGLEFPGSGAYCISGALQPIAIDRETDRGVYHDPNLWMRHRVE